MDEDTLARLAYLSVMLAALMGWMLVEFRQRMGQALRMALAWVLIFVGLMGGYGLWQDISGDFGAGQFVADSGEIRVPVGADGQYHLTAAINGVEIPFLVDTGASGIVLNKDDARRIGIDPEALAFTGQAQTANGPVASAFIRLPLIELGPFQSRDVPAFVNGGELGESLLGMDYLRQFDLQFSDGTLVLRP